MTGPPPEDVAAVLQIIRSAPSWEEANQQLRLHRIEFTLTHPVLSRTGAIGGFDPESGLLSLNARYFGNKQVDWETVVEHELTHKEQMIRAYERGGDLDKIAQSHKRYFFKKSGQVDMQRYSTHPLEMQALARNAVSTAKRKGHDVEHTLRSGDLPGYAPQLPKDRNRFHKYAYQMLQAENLVPLTKLKMEQAMLLVRLMLNEEGGLVRVCASCEQEIGPQKGNRDQFSHTYCKRHMIQMCLSNGLNDQAVVYKARPDDSFAPDLAQHPELVDQAGTERFHALTREFRKQQQQFVNRR